MNWTEDKRETEAIHYQRDSQAEGQRVEHSRKKERKVASCNFSKRKRERDKLKDRKLRFHFRNRKKRRESHHELLLWLLYELWKLLSQVWKEGPLC